MARSLNLDHQTRADHPSAGEHHASSSQGRRVLKSHKLEVVMWIFVGQILVSPLADTHPHAGAVLGLIGLVTLLVGVRIAGNTKLVTYAVFPSASLWIIARLLEAFGDSQRLYTQMAPVAGLLLSCSILLAILYHFYSVPEVPRSA